MSLIQLDYEETMAQAQELKRLAEELENAAGNKLALLEGSVAEGWEGDSATAMAQVLTQCKGDATKSSEKLLEIAQRIEKVAKEVKAADEAAKAAIEAGMAASAGAAFGGGRGF